MSSNFKPSAACCTTPAVIGPPYDAQGSFAEFAGYKMYDSGPRDATRALFVLYDVFGYSSQILRGVDLLASQGYRVFMPDFFEGSPAPLSWMPMADESGKEPPPDEKALDDFCEGPGHTERTRAKVLDLQRELQTAHPHVQKWGLVGYCWGGYVANFLLDAQSPFSACAELHPGFPGKEIAENIARPILALCSKDEPESCYAEFKPYVTAEVEYVHFPNMVHGWMSARADLYKIEVLRDFQAGYEMLTKWFQRHL